MRSGFQDVVSGNNFSLNWTIDFSRDFDGKISHKTESWVIRSVSLSLPKFLVIFIRHSILSPFNLIRLSLWAFHRHSKSIIYSRMNSAAYVCAGCKQKPCRRAFLCLQNAPNWRCGIVKSTMETFDLFASNTFSYFFHSRFPFFSLSIGHLYGFGTRFEFYSICFVRVEWNGEVVRNSTLPFWPLLALLKSVLNFIKCEQKRLKQITVRVARTRCAKRNDLRAMRALEPLFEFVYFKRQPNGWLRAFVRSSVARVSSAKMKSVSTCVE